MREYIGDEWDSNDEVVKTEVTDEELYGDGYCTQCAEMCVVCKCYINVIDMIQTEDKEYICQDCDKLTPDGENS